ncbi:MAG: PAS domain-containing protein [Bacteroidota bacterium]
MTDPVPSNRAPDAPPNTERLMALRHYHVWDTASEASFDRITELASHVLDMPIAIINLIGAERQWFKSCVGVDAEGTSLDISICTTTIQTPEVLTVPDLRADDRFADNPFVEDEPNVRFYMGAPLITGDTHRLGTLCVMDRTPRHPTPHDEETLARLAQVVVDELEQRAAERKKHAVLQAIGEAFYTVDTQWGITYANDNAAEHWGEPPDALRGRVVWELLSDAERATLEPTLRSAQREQTAVQTVYEDPEAECWYRVHAHPFEQGLSVYLHDITEQQAVAQERTLLAKAVEELNDAVLITKAKPIDAPGPPVVYANPAFEKMTGYAFNEVEGKTPRILQGPKTDRAVLDGLRAHLEREQRWEGETVNYRKDGTPYTVRWNMAPVCDEEGTCTHWVLVQQDVTERNRRETALRQQYNLLSQTQRLAGAWELEVEANTLSWTEKVYRIHEMEPGTPISTHEALSFYPEEARMRLQDALDRCMRTGETYDLELPITTAQGNARWVRTVGGVIDRDEDGTIIKVGGAIQDVTERKEASEALVAAKEEAEEMSRLKTAFLANMSHEIRTPLTSVIGFSEMLKSIDLPERAQQCTALIHKSGKRLMNTLNSVLDLSQLEAGAMRLHPNEIDAVTVLQETVHIQQRRADDAKVHIQVETPTDPVPVTLDQTAFERVVTHLIDNAVKFSPEHSTVQVRLHASSEHLQLAVQDNGIGIDETFLPHLFDAFKQESTGDARTYEGNGLGLTITKRLVDLMEGTIRVDTTKGEGTTFVVEWPRHAA